MEVFNIDLLNERAIDIGLNAVGYIAAGLLWMLIYSAFARRGRHAVAESKEAVVAVEPAGDATSPESNTAQVERSEFISLKGAESSPAAKDQPGKEVPRSVDGRRNRGEIIRVAREMVKNGVTRDMIKRTLPISDGELSLLMQSTK